MFELKRVLCRRNLWGLSLFMLLCLFFVQNGVTKYKNLLNNKIQFELVEKMKIRKYITYTQYGGYGFRLFYIPAPFSSYFINTTLVDDLTANIDASDVLNIYNSFKGKALFRNKAGGFKDFAGILILFGSLFMLYLGYDSFRHWDHLRFLSSLTTHQKIFRLTIITRLLILSLFLVLIMLLSFALFKINGIRLPAHDWLPFLAYLLSVVAMLLFFFFSGTIFCGLKSRYYVLLMLPALWFTLIFFIPGLVNTVIATRAENISSDYQLELDKMNVLMSFEKKAIQKHGRFNEEKADTKEVQQSIENFRKNEFPKIIRIETNLKQAMEKNISLFQYLSMMVPSTFYLSVSNEVSSSGHGNFIDFYDYLLEIKKRFFVFYIDKRYYSNFSEIESFIKENENIFYARSRLPRTFIPGLLLTILYIVGLIFFSYRNFKRGLVR